MLKRVLFATVMGAVCVVSGKAGATDMDTPAQICQPYQANGSLTYINYDPYGVRNDSTSAAGTVVCPIPLLYSTGRTLWIAGTDGNAGTGQDFSCTATGLDINLATVTMPSMSATTGTYTNGTIIGSYSIPDSVAKLTITCSIPKAVVGHDVSEISDFFIGY